MIEEWRKIPSFPTYEASSLGRIRSRYRVRKVRIDDGGYRALVIYVNGKAFGRNVGPLVCEAFHGPKPEWAEESAHNNGIRTDDRATNLRWDTHAGNVADIEKHGTRSKGAKHAEATRLGRERSKKRRSHDQDR